MFYGTVQGACLNPLGLGVKIHTLGLGPESAAGRDLPIQRGLACPPESPNADSQPPIGFYHNADSGEEPFAFLLFLRDR